LELKIPSFGESISEVLISEWLKAEGERVAIDEGLVVIETDKVTSEVPSPVAGVLKRVLKAAGETARVNEVIAQIEETNGAPAAVSPAADTAAAAKPAPEAAPAAPARGGETRVMPAAKRLLDEHGLAAADLQASGPGGRLLKEDVLHHIAGAPAGAPAAPAPARRSAPSTPAAPGAPAPAAPVAPALSMPPGERAEEVVPMSPLRRRAAEHLVAAQRDAALLTTFNEIDMSTVIALRKANQEAFQARHGVKLGFMSFFVKAAVEALKRVPQVNAELRGTDIVYRNYFDIGIAVGGGRGLVVPIIRCAERLGFAEIELAVADFAARARDNKLKLEELQGGTFTISNGGIYGSMLSTPIVNAPQSGILGLHAIQDRPVAREGQAVVRPMMYVALTYDHRLIDGREAVTFLKTVKECVEEPARILLEL
jgi:2-oxoglutarate dehydrogenase E2 component (dihydrolipoamide succinyltransferase)